jgi:hypothetical protein
MDGAPASCAYCGEALGSGRFCTNCGAEVGLTPIVPRAQVYPEPVAYAAPERHGTTGAVLWVGVAAALLVIVLVGGWLLLQGQGGGGATASPPLIPKRSHHTASSAPATSAASSPSPSSSASPPQHGAPVDVAPFARASAPAHAPAAVDLAGNPVTFDAANLVDGSPDTCWREPGDGTGTVLTITLDQPTRLTGVGLINGYAKIAFSGGRRFDWYAGNRRVLGVNWLFDDGSSVAQTFSDTRTLQPISIDPVTTSTVRIQITAVSPPGTGRAARDDTAISEVSLLGTPG